MMIRVALLLVSTMFAVVVDARADPFPRLDCLTPQGVQRALAEGGVRRLADLGRRLDGDIVRAELCRGGEALIYRVTLFDSLGRVRRILLDARDGRLLYDGR